MNTSTAIKLTIIFILISLECFSQSQEIVLHSNWKFRRVGDLEWLPATVPGTIHTDLLSNKKIPDPFLESNEKLVQWVDTADWEYVCEFSYQKDNRTKDTYLLFEGLDTYAEVFLNDSPILSVNNMFRSWQVDCNLKEGVNHLRVRFTSAVKKGREEVKNLPYTLPGEEKVFTRKAAYHYGWDWGPRFVTCGIWKPVKLMLVKGSYQVHNHHIIQESISDEEGILKIATDLRCTQKGEIEIQVYDQSTNQLLGSSIATIAADTVLKTNAKIKNPKRWWCNGLGDPNLYRLRIEVRNNQTHQVIATSIEKIGLRTIELIQERDSIGKSFYFKLNGKPIFIKGANVIPRDNFLPRANPKYYYDLVGTAHEMNMNMLRVWGGGVYADESFYNACDESGILVWQDFMFANTMYPGDQEFIKNVQAEVEEQVIRLRNHPSLALWCGNNEISEGWFNWGWQKQYKYSKNDSVKIWNDYQNLYEKVIAVSVSKLDQDHAYWPSSPQHGWGREESLKEGDLHYWGVWWGMEPFSKYREKVGRFMSEYGFQGMPSPSLFKKISNDRSISLQSEIVKSHQKHPTGYQTIDTYLLRDYKKPKSFEDYCYVSQLVQAEGMKIAIEAHRSQQPYCMGTMYWQLNDCWPVTSWSSMDYFGTPKAAQYFIKDAYKNEILSITHNKGKYEIISVADIPSTKKAILKVSIKNFKGVSQWSTEKEISAYAPGSNILHILDSIEVVQKINPTCSFILAELHSPSGIVSSNIYFFTQPKNLCLEKPVISVRPSKKKNSFIVSSNVLAKNIFIDGRDGITFSENYFDLIPGAPKEIEINSTQSFQQLKKNIKIKSLYDTY